MGVQIDRTRKPHINRSATGTSATIRPGVNGPQGKTGPQGAPGPALPADQIAALDNTYGRPQSLPSARIANLPRPVYAGHRGGGAYLGPQYTKALLDIAAAYDTLVIEADVKTLLDGTLVICHDDTVDAYTDGSGQVTDFTAARWRQFTVDAGGLMGDGGAWPTEHPMFLEQLLREAGNQYALMLQVDPGTGDMAAVDALVERVGVDKGTIMIQSFSQSRCAEAVALGYEALLLSTMATTPDWASVAADGILAVCAEQATITGQHVTDATAAGVEVWAYTVNSKTKHDALVALGVQGFISDDPPYIAGAYNQRTSDGFWAQSWYPGHHATRSLRGRFYADGTQPNEYGWDYLNGNVSYARLGYLKPTDPSNYVLEFEANITADGGSTSIWAAVALSNEDTFTDGGGITAGADGYNCLIRTSGTYSVSTFVDNAWTSWLTNAAPLTGYATGTWLPYRVTVTPTTIRFERRDTAEGATFSTAAAGQSRPLPYITLGRSSVGVRFRNITVT